MQLGIVGGFTRAHPTVRANLKLMKIERASDLAKVVAVVGLAQNLGALRALATEGIQQGHMRMHARTLAVSAGAETHEVLTVADALTAIKDYSLAAAAAALADLRNREP
jgi:hydroxymethylglutaryl-CoA reductase